MLFLLVHPLKSPLEAARITEAGGTVVAGRVFGMLQVSRSLGDARFKGSGVTAEPELVRYVLRSSSPDRNSSSSSSGGEDNNSDGDSEGDAVDGEVPYSMPVDLDFDLSVDTSTERRLRRCDTAPSVQGAAAGAQGTTAGAGECRTIVAKSPGRDEFLVLASDGLWGVMSNADVVRFVHQHTRGLALAPEPLDVLQSCANDLVQEALIRGSRDNITATIVYFASEGTASASASPAAPVPGALAVLASPPRTSTGGLRRCCSATFASGTGSGTGCDCGGAAQDEQHR